MVVGWADIPELSTCVGCSAAWLQSWLQSRRNGADPRPSAFQAGHIPSRRESCRCSPPSPVAADGGWWLLLLQLPPGICLMTACAVQGMAPYPGQARCLALGFWPECFRRLNVKGGQRPFPEETRSALDIEGKHVTIQGPSPDLTTSRIRSPWRAAHVRQARSRHLRPVARPSAKAGHNASLARIVGALCAVAGRCRLPLVAAVAVSVAVRRWWLSAMS